jgi:NTE family protein
LKALKDAILFNLLPLLILQFVIGWWNWKLALDGRRTRRDIARLKSEHAMRLAELQRAQTNHTNDTGAEPSTAAPRFGIALSGGGGKGAYQVGVLRVLRAAGFRPDVIAGTSAGALNATLLCLDGLDVAADFWSTVSLSQVARVGLANLAAIPLLVFGVVTAGSSEDLDASVRRTILVRYYMTLLTLNAFGVFAMGWNALGVVLSLAACTSMVTLGYLADTIVGRLGLALLSNAPLAAQIQANAPIERLRDAPTPLFVTVAAQRRIIDPNSPRWLDKPSGTLLARQPYVPEYRHVQEESDADMQQLVLQSAAIPFGVFPLRRIGRSDYVDGGIADNVPIQPLIDSGCTCIVVIHLDPSADCDGWRLTNEDDLWAREGQIRELRRLAILNLEHTEEDVAHQVRLRVASPELRRDDDSTHVGQDYKRANVRIVHIVPSESLGNFLTGTMNFSAKNAQRLMKLGEDDARARLARAPGLAAAIARPAGSVL